MRALAHMVACLLPSCGFSLSPAADQLDAPPVDVDGAPDAPDFFTCVTWSALNVDPCHASLSTPSVMMWSAGSYVLDTDAGTLALNGGTAQALPGGVIPQQSGSMVRVVNARSLTVATGASVSVVGMRPVVFVVHGAATIDDRLDASARFGVGPGPGGDDPAVCLATATGEASSGAGGGGGGGGGGYGGDGGDGGDGHGSGNGAKGAKGAKNGAAIIEPLRGGCGGGAGGDDSVPASNEGGQAGNGGGGLQLTARATIVVRGTLASNGAPGSAGGGIARVRGGGGGGGAGGAILLDGELVEILSSAALCANGGGGGEGGQLAAISSAGVPVSCTETPAPGGATQPDGGNGGAGGAGSSPNAGNATAGASSAGGGGGGGGAGRIRIRARAQAATIDAAAIVSPPPST